MKIVSEISLSRFEAWSGGRTTMNFLQDHLDEGDWDRLESYITECEGEEITDTALNDFLWFNTDEIALCMGFSNWEAFEKSFEDDDEEEEEDGDNEEESDDQDDE